MFCVNSHHRVIQRDFSCITHDVVGNMLRASAIYQARLNAMTKRESRVMRTWKISRPAVPRHPVGVVRRGTLRAAIIIIFTSPRVIKAARYTCSVRGRPLLTARTTPLDGSVGVAMVRSRGGRFARGSEEEKWRGERVRECQWGVRGWRGEEIDVEPRRNIFGADAACRWERGLTGMVRRG